MVISSEASDSHPSSYAATPACKVKSLTYFTMSITGHVAVHSSTEKKTSEMFINMKIDKNIIFEISKNEIHLIVMNCICLMYILSLR